MFPNITKYQKDFPNIEWEKIDPNLLHPNYAIYHTLTMWLLGQIKIMRPEQITFVAHQDTIVQLLDNNEHYTIINLDHFHDMGYTKDLESLHPYNWVEHLNQQNKLDSYIWIYDNNSNQESCSSFPCQKGSIHTKYILDKLSNNLDQIIICMSPELIPWKVQALYHLWCSICMQHYGEFFEIK